MTAAFKVDGQLFRGTNGAVELCLEEMTAESRRRFGDDHPLTTFLHHECEVFHMGIIVVLDGAFHDHDGRSRVAALVDAAARAMLEGDAMTDYGREWVRDTLLALLGALEAPGGRARSS